MAYFLKKNRKKDKLYLSIVNSYYDSERKQTVHSTYESFGTGQALIDQGISDTIAYLEDKVRTLNYEARQKDASEISDTAPYKYAGHFLVKSILSKLDVEPIFNIYDLTRSYHFKLFDVLSALIYARILKPCSKYKTYFEVIPYLESPCCFSYDQLLEGLSYFGDNYEKIVEIFSKLTNEKYGLHPSVGYFDCTNFYFEIDKEDDIRKKGPSKENRKDPIVGLGLLLDANQIPIGMELFPGNESEKPILRNVIKKLKDKNQITGKTIHVADKGLNCAQNIAFSKENGDGYLFSKSVKSLPEKEKTWVLLDNDDWKDVRSRDGTLLYRYKSCVEKFPYTFEIDGKKKTLCFTEKRLVTYNPKLASKKKYEIVKQIEKARNLCYSQAKRSEYGDLGKYVDFIDEDGEKAKASINESMIEKELKFAGYNMLVTSEKDMDDIDIYNTYHNLWRIEESFRIMKSDLDARPVFLQKENSIKGHFLICYFAVLLERIFQFKILDNQYSTHQIMKFIRSFKVVKGESKYINVTASSDFIKEFEKITNLPLTNYYLTERQIRQIFNYKI